TPWLVRQQSLPRPGTRPSAVLSLPGNRLVEVQQQPRQGGPGGSLGGGHPARQRRRMGRIVAREIPRLCLRGGELLRLLRQERQQHLQLLLARLPPGAAPEGVNRPLPVGGPAVG